MPRIFKLVSRPYDTLLGHVIIPDEWMLPLNSGNRMVSAAVPNQMNTSIPSPLFTAGPVTQSQMTVISLQRAHGSRYVESLWLTQGTIEQLEAMPGVAFLPSMAYLRSQLMLLDAAVASSDSNGDNHGA
jgi:hypothetical protein